MRPAAGEHRLRPLPGWTPDELVFRDSLGDRPPPAAATPGPQFSVRNGRASGVTVQVIDSAAPYYLVTGQAYDARWRATLDGRDLGPPIVVDGYAAGWRIDAPGTHTVAVSYRPQQVADLALGGSALAVLGCLALLVLRAPPRQMAGAVVDQPDPPAGGRAGARGRRPTGWTGRARRRTGRARGRTPSHAAARGARWPAWARRLTRATRRSARWPRARQPAGRLAQTPRRSAWWPTRARQLAGRPAQAARRGTRWLTRARRPGQAARPAASWPAWARRLAGWLAAIALAMALGGALLGAAAAAVAAWHLLRPPPPRLVLAAGVTVLAAVPVVWLSLRPTIAAGLSARIVQDDPWPPWLAAIGLLLIAVGAVRAERWGDTVRHGGAGRSEDARPGDDRRAGP